MRPKIYKFARVDFYPLGRFSLVPAVELSGNGRSEYSKIPLGRMEFPRFDLFLVLDLVF